MATIDTLLKQRQELDARIAKARAAEAAAQKISKLVQAAGLHEFPTEILKTEFEALANRLKAGGAEPENPIPPDPVSE